jgi:hypothetical protein
MAEFIWGAVTTAFACSMGILLSKLCSLRSNAEDVSPQYLLVNKAHYETLKQNTASLEKLIKEQPLLPDYSERESLLTETPPPSLLLI